MWSNKPPLTESAQPSAAPPPASPSAPMNSAVTVRPSSPTARSMACLGASLVIQGKITGDEDLQIDGTFEGPITLKDKRLTIGQTAQLDSEVFAREVVVYGKIHGNLHARERIEIKKNGSVVGDLTTARIMIEDGAYFKGAIEIARNNGHGPLDPASVLVDGEKKPA